MQTRIFFFSIIFFFNNLLAEDLSGYNHIYKNLRCLVCQGQSISDSNSEFAQTIKLVVNDLVKEENQRMRYTLLWRTNMETGSYTSRNLINKILCYGCCHVVVFL